MKYEKPDVDWGYIGKAALGYIGAMGLAVGLFYFSTKKPARAEPLEQIVKKEPVKKELPKLDTRRVSRTLASGIIKSVASMEGEIKGTTLADIPGFRLKDYDYLDELDAGDEEETKELWMLAKDSPLAKSAQEAYKNGNFKITYKNKDGFEGGNMKIDDKIYQFTAKNGSITFLSRDDLNYSILDE